MNVLQNIFEYFIPERDPWEHHDQNGRQVHLDEKVAEASFEFEAERQSLIDARRQLFNSITRLVTGNSELRQFKVIDTRNGIVFPVHDNVTDGVTILVKHSIKSLLISGEFQRITWFNFNSAVLGIQWEIAEIHLTGLTCRKTNAIQNTSVSTQLDHLIPFGHVMDKAGENYLY